MLDEKAFISKFDRKMIEKLKEEFGKVPVDKLPKCVEDIEKRMKEILCENLIEFFSNIEGIRISTNRQRLLIDETQFRLQIEPVFGEPRTLGIAILGGSHGSTYDMVSLGKISIDGYGLYSFVDIIMPSVFAQYKDEITNIIKSNLQSGYSQLFQIIMEKVSELEIDISEKLYIGLQAIFNAIPSRNLVERILMAMISKGKGFYILDRVFAERVSNFLKRDLISSPAQLLAQLLTVLLPFDTMHAKLAVSTGECIDLDFKKSLYLEEKPDLEKVEEALFTNIACCYPIVRQGNQYLLAVFPKELKENILPILEEHSWRLEQIFNECKNRTQRILRKLTMGPHGFNLNSESGSFIGAATGELLKRLIDPK